MRIVIVGAGAVGSYLAERLSAEGQDVVVIESDAERVEELRSSLDALVVHGNGASPSVLADVGIEKAGLLIAVTSSDAVNVLVCHAGHRFEVARKIARVEDPALRDELEQLGVDVIIDPGEMLARELLLLVRRGGVSEITEFADGRLVLLGGHITNDAPVAGITLAELREKVTGWDWIVAALVRNGDTFVARGDTTIEEDDHVLIMAKSDHTEEAIELLGLHEHRAEKVMILGATRLAELTAALFAENGINTVLVDKDAERCRSLAEHSERVVVVQGDPTDPKVLRSEGIENVDVVLALTGWDEVNILGSLVAKALGVSTAVARFHQVELVGLLAEAGIDAGVSSRLAAANAILRFVRRGRIHSVVTFQDTDAEAIELEVGTDSEAVGRSLIEIALPRSAIIGGVLRDDEAFVPRGVTVIEAGDRLIVFALPEAIPKIEKLFA
ncbi:MAG: Trk system potassium transporter TrkA [Acidimicrobiia bacterium]